MMFDMTDYISESESATHFVTQEIRLTANKEVFVNDIKQESGTVSFNEGAGTITTSNQKIVS